MKIEIELTGDELEFQRNRYTARGPDEKSINAPTDNELKVSLEKEYKHHMTRDYCASLNDEWNKLTPEQKKDKLK